MTDSELLELLNSDSRKGFEFLIDEYTPLVFKVVSSILSSFATKEDIEECVSDVFVNFYTHLDSFSEEKGTFKGYLACGARHIAIDFYRKHKKEIFSTDSLDDNEELVFDDEIALRRENNAELVKAVKSLGEPEATIIIHKYIFGETAKEIGKIVKLSPAACEKRLQRALVKLKNILGGVLT